jgi:LuxR family maltose regulon positive regulatory protein
MILKAHENLYVAIVALGMLGSIHAHRGELYVAEDYFKQAIALGEEHSIPSACLGYRGLAEIHYLRNQVEEAVTLLETALHLARRSGNTDILYNIFQLSACLALLKGDIPGVERAIQKAEEHFPTLLDVKRNPDMVALRAAGLLMQDMPKAAIDVLESGGVSAAELSSSTPNSEDGMRSIQGYLLLARALLLEDRTAAARRMLETLQPGIAASRDLRLLIEAQLLNAVLLEKQNRPEDAHKILNEALQLAEPSGYLSPFLNIGKPAYELIRREALTSGAKSDYAQKVLAAFAGQAHRVHEVSLTESDLLSGVERLTRQETQILRLLSQGLSSTEVAAELVIAVSTARSYIKNIHRKLNVHSREEVIARGKQLGLF